MPSMSFAKEIIAEEIQRIELSAEIAEMVGPDQALRFGSDIVRKKAIRWEDVEAHPLFKRKLAKIDGENAKKIKAIIQKIGWPKVSEYGEYTARNTWLLVQHMDSDVHFQESVLLKMEVLLKSSEVNKSDYALLYDRVKINRGHPQLYGSQGDCVGKEWKPKEMVDPKNVDKRRKEMDLQPISEYQQMFKNICH